jgi:siderophore synthetase component
VNPDTLTGQALLNCLVREVSGPEGQTWESDGQVTIRLARSDRLLRAASSRRSAGIGPRLDGTAELLTDGSWQPVGWDHLARLIADELTLATGATNDEFTTQVGNSHAAMTAIVEARGTSRPEDPYLASEQSLVSGHRFHPAPKARGGEPRDWLRYAPEAEASFPLRFLGVREDALTSEGDTAVLDRLGSPIASSSISVPGRAPWCLPPPFAPFTFPGPTSSASSASACGSPTACARTPVMS